MRRVLARADSQDVELGARDVRFGRTHLGVVKHPIALLREERHVHGETFRCAATLVPQCLLRLHKVLHAQQRPRQEVPCCKRRDLSRFDKRFQEKTSRDEI